MMEVVDIDFDNLGGSSSSSGKAPSVNFGSGIELLMNEKKKSSGGGGGDSRIHLSDLDNLESELNDLSKGSANSGTSGDTKTLNGLSGFNSFFNFGASEPASEPASLKMKIEEDISNDSNLGHATSESVGGAFTKTWDGFMKMGSDIPNAGSKPNSSANLSEREKRRKKRMMIKKLEEWQEKGFVKNHSHFNMDSAYEEVEDEYEGALEDKRKRDSIKLQGWWFTTVVNTLEYGNALLNPFDLNLDGWGEQVSEDLDSYDEIFAELHEKYKGGKMAPEVSLLLRIGFSAAVVNMSNKMLSSATPGFNDVMKQSPELMRMFTSAAVDTMSKQNSAFDFAKTMMNPPEEINTRFGPPPAPVETKNSAPPSRPGNMQFTPSVGNRPDLAAGRGTPMFREPGIDLQSSGAQYSGAHSSGAHSSQVQGSQSLPSVTKRPEMRGPQTTDLDHLLSGLKTKPSGPTAGPSQSQPFQMDMDMMASDTMSNRGDDSMISVSSLRDLQNTSYPKKSNRKRQNKSDKNMVSLDI
jgi:hypothetical protein